MAKRFPNVLQKREMLYEGNTTPEQLSAQAKEFVEAKRYAEALDFYNAAGNTDEIKQQRQAAIERGELFIYESACRFLGEDPVVSDLEQIAKTASSNGRESYARRVEEEYLKSDEEEEVEEE